MITNTTTNRTVMTDDFYLTRVILSRSAKTTVLKNKFAPKLSPINVIIRDDFLMMPLIGESLDANFIV